jgi:DNA-binding protein HU-beta
MIGYSGNVRIASGNSITRERPLNVKGVTMNKTDLAYIIAEKLNISKAGAGETISAMFRAISEALKRGEKAQFIGFGTFSVSRRKARTARNPRTGEKLEIPAKQTIRFKAGKELDRYIEN